MKTKAAREKFVRLVGDYLRAIPGVGTGCPELPDCQTFLVETIAGMCILTPCATGKHIASVFGRFADITRAKSLVDCNPFTGKWNHHFGEDYLCDEALEEFKRNLEELLPK